MPWQTLLIVAASVFGGGALTWVGLSAASRRRPTLGVREGRLLPCSPLPKGVNSTASDGRHAIDPLRFDGPAEEAWDRLVRVLGARPRTRLLSSTDSYLHVECSSILFRFLDDVEFLLDREARVIHFRAEARVGLGDLGVNRRRMERIRRAFHRAEAPTGGGLPAVR
jgi:uncharacterized protein (DUF1499 family)